MTAPGATAFDHAIAQQRIAANPLSSVFVIANAGSGKTKVLVDRIARLLLTDVRPDSFLCITYTKAAAAEMQRRLFEQLGAWCVADDETLCAALQDLLGIRTIPDAAQLAKARGLFARALETPGGLRIQTIHAFCERLLAKFPLEAGVPPGFSILDDREKADILDQAWRDVTAGQDHALTEAIAHLAARHDSETLRLRIEALAARPDMLAALPQDSTERAAIIRAWHSAARSAANEEAAIIAQFDWDALQNAAAVLAAGKSTDAARAEQLRTANATRAFSDLMAAFLTSTDLEPVKKLCHEPVKTEHPHISEIMARLQHDVIAGFARLRAAERADETIFAAHLALRLMGAYDAHKTAIGALDFDDLIRLAGHLLHEENSAPWVLYKLDGGLSHILIDESQDTSPAQWNLIAPLRDEFLSGQGQHTLTRTVFAVGDPKQSIYSFQGADPEKFLQESQTLMAMAGPGRAVSPILEMSFRSTPEVLAVVDKTIAHIEVAASEPEASATTRHLARRETEQGCVDWWPFAPRADAGKVDPWVAPDARKDHETPIGRLTKEIAACIAQWLKEGHGVWQKGSVRRMHAGDVLILVRKRGPLFEQMLRALKRAGLPVAGADRMTLAQDIAVQDLLTLMRVAIDPRDDLSLACLIKSPWIGMTDDDLHLGPLAYGRAREERLMDRLANADATYDGVRALVTDLCAHAHLTPEAFMTRYLEKLDTEGRSGWETLFKRLGEQARDPIEETLARARQGGGVASLAHFLSAFASDETQLKREMDEAHDSIRVMTVHGAKGLEAPIVFLPDTTTAPTAQIKTGVAFDQNGPVLVQGAKHDDARARAARDAFVAAQAREANRLLYVAMTRARDRLIVCGAQSGNGKDGRAKGCWHELVQTAMEDMPHSIACETPFGEGKRCGAPVLAQATATLGRREMHAPAWAKQAPRAAPLSQVSTRAQAPSRLARADMGLSPRRNGKDRLQRGALVHGLLQRLPDVAPHEREAAALRWLQHQGLAGGAAAKLTREALAVMTDGQFASVFGPGSRAEAPFSAVVEGGVRITGQIDRLIVAEESIVCVDFKTDRPSPKAAEHTPDRILAQMAGYRAALGAIFPNRSITCVIIWTEGPHAVVLPSALLDAAWQTVRAG